MAMPALERVRVFDLNRLLPGILYFLILGDNGAEVIMVKTGGWRTRRKVSSIYPRVDCLSPDAKPEQKVSPLISSRNVVRRCF